MPNTPNDVEVKWLVAALAHQKEDITKQVLLEIIQMICNADTYEEFKKIAYARALEYLKELENAGLVEKGSVENAKK